MQCSKLTQHGDLTSCRLVAVLCKNKVQNDLRDILGRERVRKATREVIRKGYKVVEQEKSDGSAARPVLVDPVGPEPARSWVRGRVRPLLRGAHMLVDFFVRENIASSDCSREVDL